MTRLITADDLATMLHLHPRTVHKRRAAGTLGIPEIDISEVEGHRQPRSRLDDVEAYLEGRLTRQPLDINDLHDLVGELMEREMIDREHDRPAIVVAINEWQKSRN